MDLRQEKLFALTAVQSMADRVDNYCEGFESSRSKTVFFLRVSVNVFDYHDLYN